MWYNPHICYDEDSSVSNDERQRAVYGVRRQPAAYVNITSEQHTERKRVGYAVSSASEREHMFVCFVIMYNYALIIMRAF